MAQLTVFVRSFSYKNGIPHDKSGNGGGFVFDCRGILNPGRTEKFKMQTGRDSAVIEFLEKNTKMTDFINAVLQITDISIEDYLERNFTSLEINFGCTGGQHRSVYATDRTANHIKQKFPDAKVVVEHLVQEKKNWINEPY